MDPAHDEAAAASAASAEHAPIDPVDEAAAADAAAAAPPAASIDDGVALAKPTHQRHWTHTFADGRVEPGRLHSTGDPVHFRSPRAKQQHKQMPAALDSDEDQHSQHALQQDEQEEEEEEEDDDQHTDDHRPLQHIGDDAAEEEDEFAIRMPPSASSHPPQAAVASDDSADADDDGAVAMEESSDEASEAEAAAAAGAEEAPRSQPLPSAQSSQTAVPAVVEEPVTQDATEQEAAAEEEQPGDDDDDGDDGDEDAAAEEDGAAADEAEEEQPQQEQEEEAEAEEGEEEGDADEAAIESTVPVSAPQPLPAAATVASSSAAAPAVVDSDDDVQLIDDDEPEAGAAMDDEYREDNDEEEGEEEEEAGDEDQGDEGEYGGAGGDALDADDRDHAAADIDQQEQEQEEFGEGVAEDDDEAEAGYDDDDGADDDDAAPLPVHKPLFAAARAQSQHDKDAEDEEVVDLTLSDDDDEGPAAGATESETEHKYDEDDEAEEQEAKPPAAVSNTQPPREITDLSSPPAVATAVATAAAATAAAPSAFLSRTDASPPPCAAAAAAASSTASASPAVAAASSSSSSVSPSPPALLKPLFISPFASSPHKSFGSRNGANGNGQASGKQKASFMSPTHRPSRSPLPLANLPAIPDAAAAFGAATPAAVAAASSSSAASFSSPAFAASAPSAAAPGSASSDRGRMSIKHWPQAKVPALHHPPPRRAPLITRISYCWDSLVPQLDPRPRDNNERRLPGSMLSRPFTSAFQAAAAAASRRAHSSSSSFHALERERLARRAEQLAKQELAIASYSKRRMQPVEDELTGLLSSLSMTDVAPATSTTYRTATLAQRDAYIGSDIARRIFVAKAAPTWLVSKLLEDLLGEALQQVVLDTVADAKRLAPLPEAEMKRSTELISAPPGKLIADKFNIEITGKELSCLRNLNWLNDETINFYFEMLGARAAANRAAPAHKVLGTAAQLASGRPASVLPSQQDRVHFFSSFFYTKLSGDGGAGGYNYKNVSRWLKRCKADISALDKIVLPVHVGHNHWCLAVANLKLRRFEYYDSLGGDNPECLRFLRRYVSDEMAAQCGPGKAKDSGVDSSSWVDVTVKGIPQQHNGSDCGVFTCIFANYVAENRPFDFSYRDMPYFRRRIALDIAAQKVL